MAKGWFKRISTRWLLEQVPDDGCLLVFNAKFTTWQPAASRMGGLTVFVAGQRGRNLQDLAIYKRPVPTT